MATCLRMAKTKTGVRTIYDFFTAIKSQKVRDERNADQ